jgi:hypothetical protein
MSPLHNASAPLSRREMLRQCSVGFGSLAMAGLFGRTAHAAGSTQSVCLPHFAPKVRNVILCFMPGGVSQVDAFDPKPTLSRLAGKPMPIAIERTQFDNNGSLLPSPWEFKPRGQSGLLISDLFPAIAECADELTLLRSMTGPSSEHTQASYAMHTCFPFAGHPSAGAWIHYGLGSPNRDLPGFVVVHPKGGGMPNGGLSLYSNGFLPGQNQASLFHSGEAEPVPSIRSPDRSAIQRLKLNAIQNLDSQFLLEAPDPNVEAAIRSYETAARMQSAVPEVCDLSRESEATQKLYGLDSPNPATAAYARQCLTARRLIEQGVRFVEIPSCLGPGGTPNAQPWDQHSDLENGHTNMARQVDQPIAGLLRDLRARGLLDETLVLFTGEFGRTPFSQGKNGRDHNPQGFSLWLAGGGLQHGIAYGATDEFGYRAVENPCTLFDLWATVLHLLGLDHEKLTYRFGGRDFRLTDVHGSVLKAILA